MVHRVRAGRMKSSLSDPGWQGRDTRGEWTINLPDTQYLWEDVEDGKDDGRIFSIFH